MTNVDSTGETTNSRFIGSPVTSKGLSFEEMLQIAVISAILTSLLTFIGFWVKSKMDLGIDNRKFERESAFEKLKELYLGLYAIVAQSEYVRYFYGIEVGRERVPFLEVSKTKKKVVTDLFTGQLLSEKIEETKDVVTDFNKINIANAIIEKGQYASQELLKKAVAYRFVHEHYQNDSIINVSKFQENELLLIGQIVELIVKETNKNLKKCKLEYNKKELKSGIMTTPKKQFVGGLALEYKGNRVNNLSIKANIFPKWGKREWNN